MIFLLTFILLGEGGLREYTNGEVSWFSLLFNLLPPLLKVHPGWHTFWGPSEVDFYSRTGR